MSCIFKSRVEKRERQKEREKKKDREEKERQTDRKSCLCQAGDWWIIHGLGEGLGLNSINSNTSAGTNR